MNYNRNFSSEDSGRQNVSWQCAELDYAATQWSKGQNAHLNSLKETLDWPCQSRDLDLIEVVVGPQMSSSC